jgi:hypothetical protein
MSADDGYAVARLDQKDDEWGIFHYIGDDTSLFTRERALSTYSNPIHAILEAHRVNDKSPTEYGVYVRWHVLTDCKDYFQFNTNEIVKPMKER